MYVASLFSSPILVVDTETTGFPTQPWAAVVDLAAIRVEPDGTLGPSFSCLIRPEVLDDRCTEALRISGLTVAELVEGGVAPVFARQLWERIQTIWFTWCRTGWSALGPP